jgi:peptide/nickel transport system permease protein
VLTYTARRLAINIPVLLAFSFVMYLVLYKAGDPVARYRQIPGIRAADLQRIIKLNHLDEPALPGYWHWLKGFVQGDWGVSATNQASTAAHEIFSRMPATLELLGGALLVSLLIGAPLGVYSAVRRYSGFDYTATGFAYLGYAMPTFLLGLLLQMFAIWMKDHGWAIIPLVFGSILVLMGIFRLRQGLSPRITVAVGAVFVLISVVFWDSFGGHGNLVLYTATRFSAGNSSMLTLDHLRHLVLPVVALSVVSIAGWSRYQRSATLDVLNADYLRTARAKGLSERKVIGKHALRNALLPLITVIAIDAGALFSGAVVTEAVFAWPGIGSLFIKSSLDRNVPVAMGIIMFGAFMVVAFNLIADIAYAVADPRIRLN